MALLMIMAFSFTAVMH
ncbi:hypothetical protein [Pantoea alhagi]